jgi:hypothetical protein
MALKYLSNLDLGGLEVKNLRIENFATASEPTGLAAGHIYYNTTTNKIRAYNGTAWKDVGLTLIGGTGIDIAADGVTISVDSSVVVTSGDQTIAGDKTFSDNIIVTGNLTVNGTTTTLNTTDLAVTDTKIELNAGADGGADSGIFINRGSENDPPYIYWDETNRVWTFSNDGSTHHVIPETTAYNNYEYAVSSSSVTGGANLVLTNTATTGTDSVKFAGGGDVTVSQANDIITITADTHTDNEIKDLAGGVMSGASQSGLSIAYSTSTHAATFTNDYIVATKNIDGSGGFQTFTAEGLGMDLTTPPVVSVYENANDHYKLVLTEVQVDQLNSEIDIYLANGVNYQITFQGIRG